MSTSDEPSESKKQRIANNHNNSKELNGSGRGGASGDDAPSGTRDKVALITGITGQVGGN